jgi:CDP-diacylglycerol--glycerol-3-phosphate 3-phosphatidyltransferase
MNVIPQAVKDGFVRAVAPAARLLLRVGVSPNVLTTAGALVLIGSASAFALGEVRLGGFLLLCSGVFDILDGQVARAGGRTSTFGAFYDSTLDRLGEGALFAGIALYFVQGGVPPEREVAAVGLAMAALAASMLVSYTRARAEGLGLECKVGIAARAERILLLGAPSWLFGPGPGGALLFWIVAVLALATTVTVVQRVAHVARSTRGMPDRAPPPRDTLPGRATVLRKGS